MDNTENWQSVTLDDARDKPLLIYDGDCGFCFYWVRYWHKLTGNQVVYVPYQKVEDAFPQISRQQFQSAVQYVTPDKNITSGAEASYQVLSHAPYRGIWLWLYRRVPLYARLSEKAYNLVSTHRNFFYRLCLLLYGQEHEPSRYDMIAWLFLRIWGLIYFAAFVSFGVQALGLIGSNGIIPVHDLVNTASVMLGPSRYWYLPMVFWLNTSDLMIQAVCWGGALLSLLLVFNILPRLNLILLYILYLSLVTAGQVFMSFQWDTLLLEGGILAIFLVHYRTLGIWLLRFLLFRFMLAAGLVKILSGDASWPALTALYVYFATSPLPTPLAWYANELPHFILQFSAAMSLFIELVLPFFIFLPRRLRFFAGFAFLLMQTMIILTGNYNFFNWQTVTLCLVLFDDQAIQTIIPKRWMKWMTQPSSHVKHTKLTNAFVTCFCVATIGMSLVQFQARFVGTISPALISVNNFFGQWRLVNTYGPFAVITYPRNEIIVEGSNDGNNWQTYEFKYKPGDVFEKPKWNIPHQPRLDWQMWFAALGTSEQNPWFGNFMSRLLMNSPDVTALLKTNPFPDHPPLYIRAQFYDYRFTTAEERKFNGTWWKRELIGTYFPPVRLRNLFDRNQ